jgi:hypothetical protein
MIAIGASSSIRRGLGSNVSAILSEASCSVLVFHDRAPAEPRIVIVSEDSSPAVEVGETLARTTGVANYEKIAPSARAFDQLMRLAPSHVVIDRASLDKLDISPQVLANALRLEALIVAGPRNP